MDKKVSNSRYIQVPAHILDISSLEIWTALLINIINLDIKY